MPATILPRVANEDRQVDFVTESHGGGRLATDLRFEEFDVERIRIVLDLELHRDRLSGADDLLDQREVVEVRPDTTGSSRRGSRPP